MKQLNAEKSAAKIGTVGGNPKCKTGFRLSCNNL